MREIKDIVKEINEKITYDATFYDLATLQTQNDKTFPIVNTGNGGVKISPNDKFQVYHRILDSETETNTELGKGKFPYQHRIYSMRLVGIGRQNGNYDLNDKVKNEIYDQIPVVLSQNEIVTVGDENVIRSEVFGDEFSGYDFEKLNLTVICFYIEYTIKQKICPTRK